ncbi:MULTISPECIES: hypothetical protein [Pseudomonas]|uniref:hypothetical protein n=1 Tax=Pseudomonas TaxID=286 RepID=UPI001E580883|nr:MULTISPECIES: hypothetical protein [Pseudomonas]MCD4529011.1 hypothetical protein [Pseudomonas sp. C3-2018]
MITLSLMATLLTLGWLLTYSAYGIEFTDEGFYLVWISNPFIYDVSLTQFGFIYHPLYLLLGGDITALRQANILITFGLAWGVAYNLLASLASEAREDRVVLHTAALGLAGCALVFFETWLPTPSYNSLALQALLLTSIGLLLAGKDMTRKSVYGGVAIGVGGWLAFMAKPSTALALAIGVFIYLLLSRKLSIRPLLLIAGSAIVPLLASAFLIDGSLPHFIERIELGIEFGGYLGGGHTLMQILHIDDFLLSEKAKWAILVVFAASFIATLGAWSEKKLGLLLCLAISLGWIALVVLLVSGRTSKVAELGNFQGLLIFGVVFAGALAGLTVGGIKGLKRVSASHWGFALLFLVMPHIYAFGTNKNYWVGGASAGIFWLFAGFILLGPMARGRGNWLFALPLLLAAQAVTATLLQTALEQPYRQPQALRLNTSSLDVGPQKSTVILSQGYAHYIDSAIKTARAAGFEPSTPMIDLSGQSPAILYAIGAQNIGQAWTIGGYPGSLDLARAALNRTSCEKIASAWLLLEPEGPRSISLELMSGLGSVFPERYEQVGSWQTAEGAGSFAVSRTQVIYKPLASHETLLACRALREKSRQ